LALKSDVKGSDTKIISLKNQVTQRIRAKASEQDIGTACDAKNAQNRKG
jgi:hypothetical protein